MQANQTSAAVAQNLRDAGCSPEFVEYFLALQAQGRRTRQFGLLWEHRARLLDQVHDGQKKLDCLDYLIYMMRKENGGQAGKQ